MPVDGADVLEAAALEKVVFVQPALDAVLDFAQVPAEGARILECALHARIEAAVPLFRRDFGDGAVERGVVGTLEMERYSAELLVRIDMPLSLSTTRKFFGFSSEENTASSASPLPSDASPITLTTR